MNSQHYYSFVLIMMLAGPGHAQTGPSSHVSVQLAPVGARVSKQWLPQIVSKLDQSKLRPLIAGTWESRIVEADRQSANLILRRDLRTTAGFYTFAEDDGDKLVLRWNIPNAGGPEKAIWLWDTPLSTVFLLQIDPVLLTSGALAQYCETLLAWDARPVKLTSLKLYYPASTGAEQRVIGEGVHLEQERGLFSWWLDGISSHGEAYVAIGASKAFFEHPDEALVPERFPPLKDRLKDLPRHTLFDELGKGYSEQLSTSYPVNRDKILLAELLSRGPVADVEVYQIAMGTFDRRDYRSGLVVNSRLSSFLQVVQSRGELTSYAPALERLCLGAKPDGGLQDVAVSYLFGVMARNRIDFSRVALAFVEQNRFTGSSLFYLKRNACGEKAVQALSAVAVKPEFANYKQDALRQMGARCK